MGAPAGNKNAAKAKVWTAAIQRAMESRSKLDQKACIDELAGKLLDLCMAGDLSALVELGNRLEGKPAQALTLGGDEDNPVLIQKVERVIVRGNAAD